MTEINLIVLDIFVKKRNFILDMFPTLTEKVVGKQDFAETVHIL